MPITRTQEAPWFPLAVQALSYLASAERGCSSAEMAPHLQAHAAFLRRVLAQLVRAGLIVAREGRAGGYSLARPATDITLTDIYQAALPLGDEDSPQGDDCAANCGMSSQDALQMALTEVKADMERARLEVLSHYTLANLLDRAHEVAHPQDVTAQP